MTGIIVLQCFLPFKSKAQMIEVAGGTNINTAYIPGREVYHFPGIEVKNAPGWNVAVRMSEFSGWGNPVISILIDKYNSELVNERLIKTTIGISYYPVNLKLFGNLRLQAGPEISFLFSAKGERYMRATNNINSSGYYTFVIPMPVEDKVREHTLLGASATLAYSFKLKGGLYLTPMYKFYNGLLTAECTDVFNYYSSRHSFMISVGMNFNK